MGMRGRFRELLIDNALQPWLPPYAHCGTGMIIANENHIRGSNQDDIVIYDTTLAPPILSSSGHAPEGVFLYNSVLARIEVKSTLTREDVRSFVSSSLDIARLRHTVKAGISVPFLGAFNLLFGFNSDARGNGDPDFQLRRLTEEMTHQGCDPLSGLVSMICIPGEGFWKIGEEEGKRTWHRLDSNDADDHLAWFIACVSSSCYSEHAAKQGRDPKQGLDAGIGLYFPSPYVRAEA